MAVAQAISEAWSWLEREGLLVRAPGQGPSWRILSRRARALTTYADVEAFRKGNLLPRGLLHASIATKVWVEFLRGDYDTAVFQALKEVEVAVRNAASLPNDVVGIALMRRAFDAERGPLTDTSAVEAERESRAHLFAGAIGCYKNPPSHRPVDMGAEEAVEVIMLASHLLRVVEAAVARKTATPP